MPTYGYYDNDSLTKAVAAIDAGHTRAWAARRYGVPVTTLNRKYRELKTSGDDNEKANS